MRVLRFISLFSGIEAATVAAQGTSWQCVAVAEIEPFPCSLLAEKYPHVPNLGNVELITREQIEALGHVDGVFFGSPCQDLSVAGRRAGLKGERSGLFFTAMRIVRWSGARWTLFENVPGLFSSNGGADFAAVVGEMAGVQPDVPNGGWTNSGVFAGPDGLVEYGVLDAQFFGIPQRRRRIFAIRDTGDWYGRPPILLEPYSLQGHSAPRREAGQGFAADVAPSLTSSGRGVERTGETRGQDPVIAVGIDGSDVGFSLRANASHSGDKGDGGMNCTLVASTGEIAHCLNAGGMGRQDFETETQIAHSLRGEGFDASEDGTGRGTPLVPVAYRTAGDGAVYEEGHLTAPLTTATDPSANIVAFSCKDHGADAGNIAPTLRSMGHDGSHANAGGQVAVAFTCSEQSNGFAWERDVYPTLNAQVPNDSSNIQMGIRQGMAVRRLTPSECERLQGFPDNYTAVTHRGKPAADGPRYKALGNSWAVPCVRWILERMESAHNEIEVTA